MLPPSLPLLKKKTIRAAEQNETARAAWREQAKSLSSDLVFVDETGTHIAMTPLYAYAPRGKRARGSVPRNYGAIMTVIASMSLTGMGPAFVLDGAANGTAIEIYVEQLLAPSLRPGQIVILDNLSAHFSARIRQAVEARGCRLLFLPAYSPDFSPIENAFLQVEDVVASSGGSHTPGPCRCLGIDHCSGFSWLVYSLWLSSCSSCYGSTFMNTALV